MTSLPAGSRNLGFLSTTSGAYELYTYTTLSGGSYDSQVYAVDLNGGGVALIDDLPADSFGASASSSAGAIFTADLPATGSQVLIYSDGTAAGTHVLQTAPAGQLAAAGAFGALVLYTRTTSVQQVAPAGGQSYAVYTATLYSSDGSLGSAQAIASVSYGTPGDASGGIEVIDEGISFGTVVFPAHFTTVTHTTAEQAVPGGAPQPYSVYTSTLFATDGTPAGTHDVLQVTYGTYGDASGGVSLLYGGEPPLFTATTHVAANGHSIYTATVYGSGSTAASAQSLASVTYGVAGDNTGGATVLDVLGNRTLITLDSSDASGHHKSILTTDGTVAGTHVLAAGLTGTVAHLEITGVVPATLGFFTVTGGATQVLYATNGTAAGTSKLLTTAATDKLSVSDASYTASKLVITDVAAAGTTKTYWIRADGTGFAVAGDEYVWSGPASGLWSDAANWTDTTTGAAPAALPPSAQDSVTFDAPVTQAQTIADRGASAYLTLNGDDVVTGDLTTSVLSGSGTLDVAAGARLSAATANGPLSIALAGGTFDVSGAFAATHVAEADGAKVQVGSLVATGYNVVSLDAASSFEVGSAGGAAAGALTVDAGAEVIIDYLASLLGGGDLIDDGRIVIQAPTFRGGASFDSALGSAGTISGTGSIVVPAGIELNIPTFGSSGPVGVVAGALTFGLDVGAALVLAKAAASDAVSLSGGDLLNIQSYDPLGGAPSFSMAAAIAGFDRTDEIQIAGAVTGATYTTGASPGTGTLALTNGASLVATLNLVGDYAGDQFLAVAAGSQQTEIVLATPSAPGPSPGTASGDAYTWAGPASGDWNLAANWNDVTAGAAPASVAPGAKDSVTFTKAGGTGLSQVINGAGASKSLTIGEDAVVTGALSTQTLTATGSLVVDVGASLSAATASVNALSLAGASFTSAGTLTTSGGVSETAGSKARVGGLSVTSGVTAVSLDVDSSFEVGGKGAGAAGALTIDAGATASIGAFVFYVVGGGNLVNDGVLTVAPSSVGSFTEATSLFAFNFSDGYTLSGTGVVAIQAGATLAANVNYAIQDRVAPGGLSFKLAQGATLELPQTGAGNTIDLQGGGDVLKVGASSFTMVGTSSVALFDMEAAISGFEKGDTITLSNSTAGSAEGPAADKAVYDAGASPGMGTLRLSEGGVAVGALALIGDYGGDTFYLNTTASGMTQITLDMPCFLSGTRLRAAGGGEVPVDAIRAGDLLATASGGVRPVVWVGRRRVEAMRHPRPDDVLPVRVAAGAFGLGLPTRDLFLSPEHALFLGGAMIPVKRLIDDAVIAQASEIIEPLYFHVELDRHDVVLAEGLPVESYLDTGNRDAFEGCSAVLRLHPDFAVHCWEAQGCVPLIVAGPAVDEARARLAVRRAELETWANNLLSGSLTGPGSAIGVAS